MASVKGVYYTKSDNPIRGNIKDPGYGKSKVNTILFEYEASSLASGSDISIGEKLPKDAIILDIQVFHDALGSGTTIEVGDSNANGRYIASSSTSSSGVKSLNQIGGVHYKIGTNDDDEVIGIRTGGASITGTLRGYIMYVTGLN